MKPRWRTSSFSVVCKLFICFCYSDNFGLVDPPKWCLFHSTHKVRTEFENKRVGCVCLPGHDNTDSGGVLDRRENLKTRLSTEKDLLLFICAPVLQLHYSSYFFKQKLRINLFAIRTSIGVRYDML